MALTKTKAQVAIVGAGPTGLMLAGELALAGVDVAVIERRATPELAGARAGGLHARSLEVLDQRGIAGRFLAEGQVAQVAGYAWVRLDIGDCPSRFPHGLALQQNRIEAVLADRVAELGVPVHRGCEVTGFAQDEDGVDVDLADGAKLRADYLVGCDGGRSRVRKGAGIGFPGWDASVSCLIAEAHLADTPPWGLRHDHTGIQSFAPQENGPARIMVTEPAVSRETPTLRDLSAALVAIWGTDYGVHSPTAIARFTDMARQAERYRAGRVLLAGDAAHVHFPVGGQGLNIGVQDAVNLGWKLAQVVKGMSPDSLLDSYHAERHPVAARVLRHTLAQAALMRRDARNDALHGTLAELLALDAPRRQVGAMMSGLDIRYDFGDGHPLTGRRMPDLDLATDGGPVRVATLLHAARPLLIDFGGSVDVGTWADRVPRIEARHDGPWELPVVGAVPAPAAVLVRPDGHVAWTGGPGEPPLADALTRWFGPPP